MKVCENMKIKKRLCNNQNACVNQYDNIQRWFNCNVKNKTLKIKQNKIAQLEEKLMNDVEPGYKSEKGNKELSKMAKE